MPQALIYGSYGYTGELIVAEALAKGARPILAGRSRDKVDAQARETGLDHRVFSLDDPVAVKAALEGITVVVHCAGPFSRTARQMAEGCLATGCHYTDITGEIEVFELLHSLDARAKDAGVMLLPGAGFDVVPSDCLAALLKEKLPNAEDLILAFQGVGKPSRGTATTMIENMHRGGMIRVNGQLERVPSAWQVYELDLGEGEVECMTIPWGDVSTAYYSTGIPNIRVFMAAPPNLRRMAYWSRWFGGLLASGPVQRFLKKKIQEGPPGPTEDQRRAGYSLLYGKVQDSGGRKSAEAWLRTPEGYTLTARTAWAIAERTLAGEAKPGFQTPSMAYGADFILNFEGVERRDK